MTILKRVAAKLPESWQAELKRLHFSRQLKNGTFNTDEPEYGILDSLIKPGDWVLDVGANVGHYTKRFSELVGTGGRVVAFEPVPETMALLAANVRKFKFPNVTLFNTAVSDRVDVVGMSLPKFASGLTNYYEANLTSSQDAQLTVLTVPIDALFLDRPIALIKIDAEGHEAFVLAGMNKLIRTRRPTLIVETGSEEVINSLTSLKYEAERLPGSPNVLFRPQAML
ncbi:FkbM family methyltransferase [Allohahella marinimesophila]|uniref:FkbM family methyltransferase n=1 Tax=Allohahella marinimesophila TaxID=1054972 RepID=A0ABP7Q874_9GAMM